VVEPMKARRVVITGVGAVTPLGVDIRSTWEGIKTGQSGIDYLTRFDTAGFTCRIGGEVKGFEPEKYLEPKEVKRTDFFTQYALAATHMAIQDAALAIGEESASRVGVVIGTALAGVNTIEEYHRVLLSQGHKKVSPFFIPMLLGNIAPGRIAIATGAKGPNTCIQTACAAGTHAIGEAYRLIQRGQADVVITGGTESPITPLVVAGFAKIKAVSRKNDPPQRASRPFDKNRDGFVVSEGAGIIVLEERESARRRNARIYGEMIGYGANSDAYHITAPPPEGETQAQCMRIALEDAGVNPEEVDYINAHGTSTPANDAAETKAIKRIFGAHSERLAISSSKSMVGHLLGAAGGVEAIFSVLSLYEGIIPPTINYETPDPECDLDYVPNHARRQELSIALSNSFGFGGTNGCLVFKIHPVA
jgi:3-oxoacyl-[acyl-carrier-protein] synthase II